MFRLLGLLLLSFLSLPILAQFPPAANEEGTTAIHKDSSVFINWAKTIEVVRGKQNLADDSLNFATIGDPELVLGKADNQTVSLGDHGMAILTFDPPIQDGDGFDFAVFENGFATQGGYFLELAFVEVSSDGQFFVRFPATSLTDTSLQLSTFDLVNPTEINNLAGKYVANFGTPFDLAELNNTPNLDISNITHVKIVDVVGSLVDSLATFDQFGHKVNDPFPTPFPSGGFDLDAVGVIHEQKSTSVNDYNTLPPIVQVFPNPISKKEHLTIQFPINKLDNWQVQLFSNDGTFLKKLILTNPTSILEFPAFAKGIYWLKISNHESSIVKKIVVAD